MQTLFIILHKKLESKIPKGFNLNNPALLCGVNGNNGIGTRKGFNLIAISYSTHFGVNTSLVTTTTGYASTALSNHPWLLKFNAFRVF
jgi:hypothetical protein